MVVWIGRFGGEAGESLISLRLLAALVMFSFHAVFILTETVHLFSPLWAKEEGEKRKEWTGQREEKAHRIIIMLYYKDRNVNVKCFAIIQMGQQGVTGGKWESQMDWGGNLSQAASPGTWIKKCALECFHLQDIPFHNVKAVFVQLQYVINKLANIIRLLKDSYHGK